jgi:glycerol-3-phosphate O-acyltransferase
VNFGAPVSMREYCALRGLDFQKLAGEARKQAIGELGKHLMARVGSIVPVVPVPLIASVLLEKEKVSELELKSAVEQLIARLEAKGAHVYIPRKDLDYAITVGLRMLTLRRLVEEKDGLYTVRPIELPLVRYYANSIAHLR